MYIYISHHFPFISPYWLVKSSYMVDYSNPQKRCRKVLQFNYAFFIIFRFQTWKCSQASYFNFGCSWGYKCIGNHSYRACTSQLFYLWREIAMNMPYYPVFKYTHLKPPRYPVNPDNCCLDPHLRFNHRSKAHNSWWFLTIYLARLPYIYIYTPSIPPLYIIKW